MPFREVGTVFRIGRSTLETLPELAGVALTERAPNLEDVFLKIAGTGLLRQ
ncbi:MAG: hypothetical protein U5O39_06885 [Gammaproteobacteria bacterium]|nr:hypothetical protein [Gammaproteobacteria bacterium]